MKNTLKTIAFTAAAFCATAAFAANQARVEVPFDFTAKGHSYPAGTYEVSLDSAHNFVTMASKADPSKHLTWTVGSSEVATSPALVKFDEIGSDYALKSIQVGERVTPNLNPSSKHGVVATTSIGGQ